MSSIKVHVGTPSSNFEEWTTAEVYFHGFAALPSERGESTKSPGFSCFGHKWRVYLYPGGHGDSDDGMVAVYLCNRTKKAIKIQWRLSVRNAAGKEVVSAVEPRTNVLDGLGGNRPGRGHSNFANLSVLMDALVEGSLIVEVRMKLVEASTYSSQFIPQNPITKNILNKFNDEESADVIFEIGSESQNGEEEALKKAETTTTFHAHRVILQDGASMLAEMCKPSQVGDSTTSVSITDVKPEIFRHMLYYVYGGKLTKKELKDNAEEIINACDKYGIVNLKLEAEVSYVNSTTLTNDNIIDNMLYADAMNCALLKEAVMDYIVAEKKSIMGKVSFSNVPGDMITDILAAVARGEESEDDSDSENGEGESIDYNKMRVGTLRKILDEKGLDVDGSREAMIALLKENA